MRGRACTRDVEDAVPYGVLSMVHEKAPQRGARYNRDPGGREIYCRGFFLQKTQAGAGGVTGK